MLDTVKTGGLANAQLRIKQTLGIEGADEGELTANMGKAILSQMRSTFGAAFTEREGDKLDRIEANFGKSAATNRRLLKNLETILDREARRGLSAAKKAGDDFSIEELENLLKVKVQPEEAQPQEQASPGVLFSSPQFGEVTEADIQQTMTENNMTREQVLQKLGAQ